MEFKLTVVIAVVNLCNLFTGTNTEVVIFENTTTTNELVSVYKNVTKMQTNEFTEVEIVSKTNPFLLKCDFFLQFFVLLGPCSHSRSTTAKTEIKLSTSQNTFSVT